MKIYRTEVDNKYRPDHQDYVWPPQNQRPEMDFGVEQDFDNWILLQDDLLTDSPAEADFNYVPIFFNRWYVNTPDEDGHWGGGMDELAEVFESHKISGLRTFVISEAGAKGVMPEINWDDVIIFTASRRCDDGGIDIPLLSAPHILPETIPEKKWLASFVGSLYTDGARTAMEEELRDCGNCWIENAENGSEYFVDLMLSSYIALCPRGTGGQSFRFFEAMSLGTVPLYISDMDCRPFKKWIDWNRCSFWVKDTHNLSTYLTGLEISYGDDLRIKGQNAAYAYENYLKYGKWCRFVIKELELL